MIPSYATTYETLGFKTLPVTYGKKSVPPPEWTHTSSAELWGSVSGRHNVALQAGHNKMFLLDPDTENGSETVSRYLAGLGINAWRITTWRGYTHHWVRTVAPPGTQWNGKLVDNMGDWRAKNGYGLAAPSYVRMGSQNGFYTLPNDNPLQVPLVAWEDIKPLLRFATSAQKIDATDLVIPVPTVRRAIPGWLAETAKEVYSVATEPGPIPISIGSRHWESRSEAAMSAMMSGLLNGYSYREVMRWFGEYKTSNWWIKTTEKAISWLSNEAERPLLSGMYNSDYDGIQLKDQDVLHAMISILWYVGSLQGGVSNRDLQMLVSRGRQSVSASVSRLIKHGIVTLVEKSDGAKASIYRIDPTVARSERSSSPLSELHQETFRHGGISHTQRRIINALSEPKSPAQLSAELETSSSGVYGALKKLSGIGLVRKEGGLWVANQVHKDEVEAMLDVHDSYVKRKSRISMERGLYHRNRG